MEAVREQRLAAIAWAVSGAFGPVVPLIIFGLNYKKSKFVGFHALQAALAYASLVAVAVIAGVVIGGGTALVVARDGVPEPGTDMPEELRAVMLVMGGLTVAVYFGLVVFSLFFANRAARGEWALYPLFNRIAASLYDVSDVRVVVRTEPAPEPANETPS